jgi:N-methylhydantoinase A
VTDANLVLGRIDGSRFLDGRFPLDLAAARAAIKRDVADPLGFSVERAALGVLTVVNSNMARLLRDVLVQRGYDPRVFALLAFGGGGPLHACSVGSEAGLPRVVIPCHPSTFSAFGIFAADMRNDQESMFVRPAFGVNDDELAAAYRELEDSARGALTGDENDAVDLTHAAGLRYAGQEYMIDVERRRSSKVSDYVTGFHAEHARLYGFERSDVPVEFVKLSVCGVVKMEDPRDAPDDRYTGPPSGETRRREVWSSHGLAEVPVLERADLLPGVHLVGPSVIEDRHRNLILDRVAASLSLANDTRASTVA